MNSPSVAFTSACTGYFTLGLLLLPFLNVVIVPASATTVGTFCQNEEFTAQCAQDEVVVMRVARYGRMKLSRCVRKDYGYIGCGSDVMGIAHSFCSGHRECVIPVPNEQLDARPPCPEDFKSYLEAGYDCIKVVTAEKRQCDVSTSVEITSSEGIIASVVTKDTGCGSHKAPWVIKGQPGQRVNITLLDFSVGAVGTGNAPSPVVDDSRCIAYAIFREKAVNRRSTLCGAKKMEENAYMSVGNELEVLILGTQTPETTRHFLLRYQVIGCANLPAPSGGWARRDGDVMYVGCKNSEETWRVVCKNSQWVGEMGNCTSASIGASWPDVPVSFGVSIGIIILIALGIAGCILLAGLVCMHRRRRDLPRKPHVPPPPPMAESGIIDDFNKKSLYGYSRQKSGNGGGGGNGMNVGSSGGDIYWSRREAGGPLAENEYASIQDGYPPVSPTGSAMPDPADFGANRASSALPPPPYPPTSVSGGGVQVPGHFSTGGRHKGTDVSPPRLQGLSQSTGSLETDAREYFVLDPDEPRGHRMVAINDR